LSNEYVQLENNDQSRAMVNGLDAIHFGTELESNFQISEKLTLGAFLSLGNWKWNNDVEAKLFDENDQIVDTVNVYAKGLYVGGQPQIQTGLFLNTRLLDFFEIKFDLSYNARNYAMFDPTKRNNEADRSQSLLLPSYYLSNIRMQFPFKITGYDVLIYANCNNILNTKYILKGEDGPLHDIDTFRGFWSFGRTFDLGFKFTF
jgi:hypothetical protein